MPRAETSDGNSKAPRHASTASLHWSHWIVLFAEPRVTIGMAIVDSRDRMAILNLGGSSLIQPWLAVISSIITRAGYSKAPKYRQGHGLYCVLSAIAIKRDYLGIVFRPKSLDQTSWWWIVTMGSFMIRIITHIQNPGGQHHWASFHHSVSQHVGNCLQPEASHNHLSNHNLQTSDLSFPHHYLSLLSVAIESSNYSVGSREYDISIRIRKRFSNNTLLYRAFESKLLNNRKKGGGEQGEFCAPRREWFTFEQNYLRNFQKFVRLAKSNNS